MSLHVTIEKWLISHGWAKSSEDAQALIASSRVYRNGYPVEKSTTLISASDEIYIHDPDIPHYVSRGGDKIDFAFNHFQETIEPDWVVDVGASTGGFTDYLIQHGAKGVIAIDVGTHQLHEKLKASPQVISLERTHILDLRTLPHKAHRAVIDVSFISLTRVFPHVWQLLAPPRWVLMLYKPQFELPLKYIAKGGKVRDPVAARDHVESFMNSLQASYHPTVLRQCACDIRGKKKGNQEYWILIKE